MNKLLFVAVVVQLIMYAGVNAQEPATIAVKKFGFTWQVQGDSLTCSLVAPVSGWVACGFKPIKKMKGANIIIGNSIGGTATVVDHFGTDLVKHEPDTAIGGTSDVTSASCTEKEGKTTLSFTIPLNPDDTKDVKLQKGEKVKVIFSASKYDVLTKIHTMRASAEITF